MKIRLGLDADFGAAGRVWASAQAARRGEPLPPENEDRLEGYRDREEVFLVVADDAGSIIGMGLGIQAREDDGAGPPIPGRCHISMVAVQPDAWRRGIGEAIVRRVLDEAIVRGFVVAQLWTQSDNASADRLYRRLGFELSGREKRDELDQHIRHYERVL